MSREWTDGPPRTPEDDRFRAIFWITYLVVMVGLASLAWALWH